MERTAQTRHQEIPRVLMEKYQSIKMRNDHYSMQAFANKIGLSSGALSSLLNGKRQLSYKKACSLAIALNLDSDEEKIFLSDYSVKPHSKNKESSNSLQFQMEHYQFMTQWHFMAILSLMKLKDFQSDYLWIAQRLNIESQQVKKAIEILIKFNLIIEKEGRWIRSKATFQTSDEVKNLALQQSHINNLELAKKAIKNIELENRDFTSLTFCMDKSRLKKLKQMIREFQDQVCDRLETYKASDVFRLSIQAFPLTVNQMNISNKEMTNEKHK